MKKCSECGNNSPIHSGYCVVCGTSLELAQNARRERFLFFMTPFFLCLLGIAAGIELGYKNPLESGLSIGGTFAIIYLAAGMFYWALARLFRLPSAPDSYWCAGIFTILHLLVCVFLSYNLEIHLFGTSEKSMGILEYNKSRLSLLAAIYLPTLFTGFLAVAARARVNLRPETPGQRAFLFRNAVWIIPGFVFITSMILLSAQPEETRSLIKARMLYESDAADLAIKIASHALEKKEDFAPLHYVKGSAIIDSAPASFTPAQALYHLQRAAILEPGNARYLYKVSVAQDIEQNREMAIEAASAAVSLQPADSFLWQHLGELQLKYRNYADAISAYRQALKLEPENATLLNNLAFTCLEVNQDLPQALAMARKSVELMPGFVFNTDTLAWALYKNGHFTEALEVISPIYADRSELSGEVDFHYAMILHANKLLADPVKTLEKMLAKPDVINNMPLQKQINEAKMKILFEMPEKDNGQNEAEKLE